MAKKQEETLTYDELIERSIPIFTSLTEQINNVLDLLNNEYLNSPKDQDTVDKETADLLDLLIKYMGCRKEEVVGFKGLFLAIKGIYNLDQLDDLISDPDEALKQLRLRFDIPPDAIDPDEAVGYIMMGMSLHLIYLSNTNCKKCIELFDVIKTKIEESIKFLETQILTLLPHLIDSYSKETILECLKDTKDRSFYKEYDEDYLDPLFKEPLMDYFHLACLFEDINNGLGYLQTLEEVLIDAKDELKYKSRKERYEKVRFAAPTISFDD